MLKSFRKFIPLFKVEEQTDGTLHVYGLVTAEKPDQVDEICDYESTKPFYQKLVARYMKVTSSVEGMETSLAPLREMHQLKAVGCGKSIDFMDDKKEILMGFHVVESEACKKVKAGVLIGFSQGGDYVKTWPKGKYTWYTADPGEVSLVDSPCLEDAVIYTLAEKTFAYVKADGSTELRKFQVQSKANAGAGAVDHDRGGSMTIAEKIERVKKAHAQVSATIRKGMYEVKTVADILSMLRSTCEWLYDEAEWEGDASEVPAKLKEILVGLGNVFLELVQEEVGELITATGGGAEKGAKAMLTPELLKKLAAAGTGTVTLSKKELEELAGLGKAAKSIHGHLADMQKAMGEHHDAMHKAHEDHAIAMKKAHTDHLTKMHDCVGKAMKALGAAESGNTEISGGAEKVAGSDAAKAAAAAAATAAAGKESFTKAEVEDLLKKQGEDLQKKLDDAIAKLAPADPAAKAKLTLVPKPGEEVKDKSVEKVAPTSGSHGGERSTKDAVGF